MNGAKVFQNNECETSADGESGWQEIAADGRSLRFVRVKPSVWEQWQREALRLAQAAEEPA
jgi:hypothetical protein